MHPIQATHLVSSIVWVLNIATEGCTGRMWNCLLNRQVSSRNAIQNKYIDCRELHFTYNWCQAFFVSFIRGKREEWSILLIPEDSASLLRQSWGNYPSHSVGHAVGSAHLPLFLFVSVLVTCLSCHLSLWHFLLLHLSHSLTSEFLLP